ncbi:MAG: DUF4347 domain-containing protein [Elainella sp. C42_A2020_010]|nr:DUF4347 domain-containing protein [Elainella sp. C42_A2020_010]
MACPSMRTALVVIDSAVDDYHTLLQGVLPDTEALLLHAHSDGVAQITAALANYTGIKQLHIVAATHANGLQLGSDYLTLFNLDRYGWQLQQWGDALATNARILVYAYGEIQVASFSAGFLNRLRLLTGADITVFEPAVFEPCDHSVGLG